MMMTFINSPFTLTLNEDFMLCSQYKDVIQSMSSYGRCNGNYFVNYNL